MDVSCSPSPGPMPVVVMMMMTTGRLAAACKIFGFEYVPPNQNSNDNTRQSGCVACAGGRHFGEARWIQEGREVQNPRLGFNFPTTQAPCCTTTTPAPTTKLANHTGCGVRTTSRIVGGQDATSIEQFPWQCGLLNATDNSPQGCGATLMSCDPVIIVTSAACVSGNFATTPDKLKVVCGTKSLTDTSGGTVLQVTKITPHESFVSSTFENDIALLEVSGSFDCTKSTITPACFPSTQQYSYVGWPDGIVSGWGRTSENGASSFSSLKYVALPVVSDSVCDAALQSFSVKDSMICAGFREGQKDACIDDGGGPIVITDKRDADAKEGFCLMGIVSFGEGCARENKYGVYTEVSKYISWIASKSGFLPP